MRKIKAPKGSLFDQTTVCISDKGQTLRIQDREEVLYFQKDDFPDEVGREGSAMFVCFQMELTPESKYDGMFHISKDQVAAIGDWFQTKYSKKPWARVKK